MNATIRHLCAAILATMIALAAPAHAQREITDAPDPYVHAGAGIAFPAKVDEFRRGRVFEYSPDGANASVGYKPPAQKGEMTVYVYPGKGGSCSDWFRDADAAVMNRAGVARIDTAAPLRLVPEGLPDQLSASYTIPPGTYGFDHPEMVSYVWVGCVADGNWVVKYRGSFEAADAAKASGLAERLFAAIDWSPLTGG
jgi:hypothetical protein